MKKTKKITLKDTVYEAVKRLIVTGQLPASARMTEAELATRLDVSRTPVREALARLERDGLVQGRPRQGYVVVDFDITLFCEAFQIRESLDGLAAELAATKINASGRRRLLDIVDGCEKLAAVANRSTKDYFEELQLGLDLHRVIAEISGNQMLNDVIGGILDKCQHYIWAEMLWLDDWDETRREHEEIVNAICAGDARLAGELARRHVRGACDATLRVLKTKGEIQELMNAARVPALARKIAS